MPATFRPSRHVKMVLCVANMSTTRRACRARGIWRTTRQTGKWAALQLQTTSRPIKLRGCYEETALVEFRLYTTSTLIHVSRSNNAVVLCILRPQQPPPLLSRTNSTNTTQQECQAVHDIAAPPRIAHYIGKYEMSSAKNATT